MIVRARILRLAFIFSVLTLTSSFAITTTISQDNSCPSSTNKNSDETMIPLSKYRSVKTVMPRPPRHWVGNAFHVYPVFANKAFTQELSPLLMFDYAAPKTFPASTGQPKGVGQHPHRGFETVTIAFQGSVEHHDSTGKSGIIGPGDVQWMTAGRGIIHQEYHSKEFTREGGTFEMCQLWVNLPKKYKMSKPGYQGILNKNIPVVDLPLNKEENGGSESVGTARIIAGELGETQGAAKTYSPVQMWDVSLPKAGSEVEFPFAKDHNCIVFVRRGSVEIISGEGEALKASKLGPQDVALMRTDGSDLLKIRVLETNSSLIIMGGEPLDEPIAARGPFVMNTQEELSNAMMDYSSGKMGR